MNSILEPNVPFKTVHKYKFRTPPLQKSFFVKNALINKFKILPSKSTKTIQWGHLLKEHHHIKYKNYRSLYQKKCKMNYYNHYHKINQDNIKKTLKCIKSTLSMINNPSNFPKILVCNDTKSTELIEIGNIFNNFWSLLKIKKVLNIPINTSLILLNIVWILRTVYRQVQ